MSTKRLVVVVPGMGSDLSSWTDLLTRLKTEPELADNVTWLQARHNARLTSFERIETLARNLSADIDVAWRNANGFDEVLLLGHSVGGLIVRQAYLLASGAGPEEDSTLPWAAAVQRIVLLASVNRGVNGVDRRGPRPWKYPLLLANWLFRVFWVLQRLLAYDLMRGSPFITNLRIQWILHFSNLAAAPKVVQLLGSDDSIVTRADSIDIDQLKLGWHATVPNSNHSNLHRVGDSQYGPARYTLIRAALLDDVPAGENAETVQGPRRVVFLLHGIRSGIGAWPTALSRLIGQRFTPQDTEVIAATYGYFGAIKFALPTTRRQHLPWFQDQYAQCLARNPHAEFIFVGHSNGTYLFGESLAVIPAMRFHRAVLVASVLPPDYNWAERVRRRQLHSLCTLRSNLDWPVGLMCSALSGLGMRDVGPGGFYGFTNADQRTTEDLYWYNGGHSKALEPGHLSHLVDLLDPPAANPVCQVCAVTNTSPPAWFSTLSRIAKPLALPVVAVVAALLALACHAIFMAGAAFAIPALLALAVAAVVIVDVV